MLVQFIKGYDILPDYLLLGTLAHLYLKYASLEALWRAAQMICYEVSIGLILIVHLVSVFGSAKVRSGYSSIYLSN